MRRYSGEVLRFWMPSHVFCCLRGDHVILLDLRRDQYLALDAEQSRGLAYTVHDWPQTPPENGPRESELHHDAELTNWLVERGLLTPDQDHSRKQQSIPKPSAALLDSVTLRNNYQIKLRHITAFILATVRASLTIRFRSIESIVTGVARRRSRRSVPERFDWGSARELVWIFHRLRPFFFSSDNFCLFDSLTLLHFLGYFGVFPRWVFGVQTAPFAAHCWVQQDNVIFNGSAEDASWYTPIMIV